MAKIPVKFFKGNLEAVAEMVHAYNKLIDHTIPEIQKIMLDTASRLLNGPRDLDWAETMCFAVKKLFDDEVEEYSEPNVEFYFSPSHSNFLLMEYKG